MENARTRSHKPVTKTLGKMRILVVEDHCDTRTVLATLLSRCGCQTVIAKNTNDGSAFCPRREVVPRKIIRPSLLLSGQGAACERQNEIAGKIRPVAPSSCVARNKARYSVLPLVPS